MTDQQARAIKAIRDAARAWCRADEGDPDADAAFDEVISAAIQQDDLVVRLTAALRASDEILRIMVAKPDGTEYAYAETRYSTFVHVADVREQNRALLAEAEARMKEG